MFFIFLYKNECTSTINPLKRFYTTKIIYLQYPKIVFPFLQFKTTEANAILR